MRKRGARKIGAPLRPRAASQPGVEPSPRSGRRATPGEPPRRDVTAFDERAQDYEDGRLGRLHHNIADRAAELALRGQPAPSYVLDVGCGTGYLLRLLARRCPGAIELAGVDPSPAMIEMAGFKADDGRLHYRSGIAEHLPFPESHFDLLVSTTSFDHWSDQAAGLKECARVLKPGGHLVLVDQFSYLLIPTLLAGRRGKARTRTRCSRLLLDAGFKTLKWHGLYAVIIKAVTATKGH